MLLGRRFLVGAVAALGVLALTSAASAQTTNFPMAGSWAQNRGNLIDIPLTGDKPCAINVQNNGMGATPPPFVMGDFGQPLRAAGANCIPGSGSVTVMGAAPRTISLVGVTNMQAGAGNAPFYQDGITKQSAALPLVPTVIQLATNFFLSGPGSVLVTPTNISSGTPTGMFNEDAYLTQVGRAGASFGWCLGGATQNPNCTTPNPALNGAVNTYNGLIRYTPGTNAFGGTMTMLIQGAGTLSVQFGDGPQGTTRVLHLPIGGMGAQHPGAFYAKSDFDTLANGTVKQSPVYTAGGKIQSSVTPNPTIMLGSTTNLNYGFPWTTGQVYARNTGTNMGAMATTTLSATGSDARTPGGQGVITMVAGGASARLNSAQYFSAIDIVRMTIGDAPPTPASSPAGLAAGAVLMLLAVGYAARRRF